MLHESIKKPIDEGVAEFLSSLPADVTLVAAAKTRTPEEVQAAVRGGVKVIGYNYVQEAERMREIIGDQVQWHMIGHLQRNKVKKAIQIFDLIETIDSVRLAQEVDHRCAAIGKCMPVMVEVNSGREASKSGVFPEDVDPLVRSLSQLSNIRVQGLMTMGLFGEPEACRPYFKATKDAFDRLKAAEIVNVEMNYLSMGMSDSYHVALEEGANVIRIGTTLFGERKY